MDKEKLEKELTMFEKMEQKANESLKDEGPPGFAWIVIVACVVLLVLLSTLT